MIIACVSVALWCRRGDASSIWQRGARQSAVADLHSATGQARFFLGGLRRGRTLLADSGQGGSTTEAKSLWTPTGAELDRLDKLREDPFVSVAYFSVSSTSGMKLGRLEVAVLHDKAPLAAENLVLSVQGKTPGDTHPFKTLHVTPVEGPAGRGLVFPARAPSAFGGPFRDDPGGLALKHDRRGLLSMDTPTGVPHANSGPFRIMAGPDPSRDGKHVVFGEVVGGWNVLDELLDPAQPFVGVITDSGMVRTSPRAGEAPGRLHVDAEIERVKYRSGLRMDWMRWYTNLATDMSLPKVWFEVSIKGQYAGRIEFVLFARESPLWAETFYLMCTGEAGNAPNGKPYHYKGMTFYRIIRDFIDQAGVDAPSPLGGMFLCDKGGLALNHTRMGLLSAAHVGPNTNTNHFSIMMSPQQHLDGRHAIFGDIVDGHDVALRVNQLATPGNDLMYSPDAVVSDCGAIRRGTYMESEEFRRIIATEKERIAKAGGK